MPAHDDDLAREFRDAYSVLLARSPAAPAFQELTRADDAGPAGATSHDLVEFDFRRNGDGPAAPPRRRLAPVALAVAAALLLVAGIVATSADREGLRTTGDPTSEADGSAPPSAESGAAPDAWSLVLHGAAPFGDDDSGVSAVVAGGPGFVAVGTSGGHAAVWTSVDGRKWSRRPHDERLFGGAGEMSMADVTVGGPGLVAVGTEERCTEREVLDENGAPRVDEIGVPEPGTECTDGRAVVWTSTDGVDWARVDHDDAVFGGSKFYRMSAVTRGGPGLVAIGRSEEFGGGDTFVEGNSVDVDAVAWTSVDGLIWSRVEDTAAFGGDGQQEMLDVTAGGPGLVAVGRDGSGFWWDNSPVQDAAVWISSDGRKWSRVPHDDDVFGIARPTMLGVTRGGPGLVAVGRSASRAAVWTSVDGLTWSVFPLDEPTERRGAMAAMAAVTAGGPGLVAVGARDGRGVAWTSPDGTSWSEVAGTSPVPLGEWLWDVVADGERTVGFGFTIERARKEE